MPAIRLEKPSANQILSQAKLYVDELNQKSEELESEIEAITGKKSKAWLAAEHALANPAASSSKARAKAARASKAEENAELEGLRKENTALRARLDELKKKASVPAPSPAASHRPFTPSQSHPVSSPRDSSVSPFPSSRPRSLAQPPSFPFSQILGAALGDPPSDLGSPQSQSHERSPSRSVTPAFRIQSPDQDLHLPLHKVRFYVVVSFFCSSRPQLFPSPSPLTFLTCRVKPPSRPITENGSQERKPTSFITKKKKKKKSRSE